MDLETGTPHLFGGAPVLRPKNSPTPCDRCPKCVGKEEKNPTVGRKAELSAKNDQTLRLYFEVKATAGRCLSRQAIQDETLSRNLGLIELALANHDRQMTHTLLKAMAARI